MAEIQDLSIDDILPRERVRNSDISFQNISINIFTILKVIREKVSGYPI